MCETTKRKQGTGKPDVPEEGTHLAQIRPGRMFVHLKGREVRSFFSAFSLPFFCIPWRVAVGTGWDWWGVLCPPDL